MSRYQWPARAKKGKDRPLERMRYNALTDGVLLGEAVLARRQAQRRAALRPSRLLARLVPGVEANLWAPIGPSTILRGQGSSRPRVAGRVRDLAVKVKADDGSTRAYAATANGGVWFTSDAGLTWSPLGNWLATPTPEHINRAANALVSGCLLVLFGEAADGSADTVYVGTGELTPYAIGMPGGRLGGVGVLKLNKPVTDVLLDPFGQHWDRELSTPDLTGHGIFRLASDPGDANKLVAATSNGLFERDAAGHWTRVSVAPFDAAPAKATTDVAWVDVGSGAKRLWVAVRDGTNTAVWTSTNGTAGPFQRVDLPGVESDSRLGIAVAPSDPTVVYVLGKGPRLWRINGVTPTRVQKLPDKLFKSLEDQSDYDLAVAVHPDNKEIVAAGGATINAGGEWSASLFKFTVVTLPGPGGGLTAGFLDANQADPATDPTFVGHGVHADIHKICFIKGAGTAVQMWVGCDGGVYSSGDAGDRHTFLARNAGLAVTETGFLASHPENEAYVIAGAQDNGTLLRIGDTVWLYSDTHTGDGGSTLFHPVKNSYYLAQVTGANWCSNGNLSPPVLRGTGGDSEKAESDSALFYSGGDVRRVGATNQVRLAIGTNRVWLADDWNPDSTSPTSWVTLPSGNDPRARRSHNTDADTYGNGTGQVVACRWAADDRLLALIQSWQGTGEDSAVLLFVRGTGGAWQRREISAHANKKDTYADGDIPQPTSSYLPPLGSWSDIAAHDASRGPNGSCYVACTGHVTQDGDNLIESTHMDTLWWYDGVDKWYPTGLRNSANGTKAPAYAVLCDPTDASIVYVGTAINVWRGVLTFTGATPSWTWGVFSNGLPEAAVQDLSIYNHGATRILRAAIQARGVWEVDLSTPAGPVRRTFLRVHANDARRAASTPLTNPTRIGPPNWPWHASPDIRIRPAPLNMGEPVPPPPPSLSAGVWNGGTADTYWLWVFQTALHKIDPLVRANGQWTDHFRARLIENDPANDPVRGNRIDAARWTATVTRDNVFTSPWDDRGAHAGAAPEPQPTEADLLELVVENPTPAGSSLGQGPPEVSMVTQSRYKIDIMVHYRDLRPLPETDVRVALFRMPLPANAADWPTVTIDAALKTSIEQLMSGSPPGGWSLPAPWVVADASARTKPLLAPVEARTPRAVTFETSFAGTTTGDLILLLAVVHSTPDPVNAASLTGANLKELIQTCHQVAARVVQISP